MPKQTAGHDRLGDFAPQFAHLNDDVLFGQVWDREDELAPKLRSIATVSTLVGKGITGEALRHHMMTARTNGVTRTEMAALLTHVAFYAGWPNAWGAFPLAVEVYADDAPDSPELHGGFFGMGEANEGFSQYFSGRSWLKALSKDGDPLPVFNVTFEPGCRNNWHIHHASTGGGQVLICVEGRGWYQAEGEEARPLAPGDVVEIPANVKHWHGAASDSWFSHLAIAVPGTDTSNEWCEPVRDEEYDSLNA